MDRPPFPAAQVAAACVDARAELRLASDADEVQLVRLVEAALALAEGFTGAVLIARDWEAAMPAGTAWAALDEAPVRAITAVEADGGVLAAEAYGIDIDGDAVGWVRVHAPPADGRVRVRFVAGMAADWAALPAPIRQGVVMLAAHLWNGGTGLPPAAVSALWRPWRRMRLTVRP